MLIRSQDRTKLVDITGKTIVASGANDIKISYANSSVRLGHYESKEKATKVLDFIQESYINGHIDFQMPKDEDINEWRIEKNSLKKF
mgnify:CR=1 FL=1